MNEKGQFIYDDGIAYISRKELAKLLKVTNQQILNYEKVQRYNTPLQKSYRKLLGNQSFYDMIYAISWYKEFVYGEKRSKTDSPASKSIENVDFDAGDEEEITDTTIITRKNMREVREYEDAKKARVVREKEQFDLKVKKGDYIRRDDSDKATTKMAQHLLSTMKQIQDTLPTTIRENFSPDCATKYDVDFIREIVNKYFKKSVSELKNNLDKEEASE